MPSYLFRRGAVYCTRLIVPPRLRPIIGKSDLGRSLRTKDLAEAKRLLPHWLAEAQAVLAAAEAEIAGQAASAVPFDPFANMTLERFKGLERHQREELAQVIAEDDLEERLARPDAKLSTDDVAPVARLLKRARAERDRYSQRYKARKDRDRRHVADAKPHGPTLWTNPASAGGVMLDGKIIELWAAERKVQAKGVDTHRRVAEWFYARVGRKPVGEISRQDVLAFKAKLVEEGQSAANIKMKLSRLRTLLQWAADNGHAESNAAHGITIKDAEAAKNKRRPFDLPALNAIFSSPVYAKGERPTRGRGEAAYWLPLLALFAGGRMEELGQLRPEDVVRLSYPDPDGKEQSGWFLRLTEDADDGLTLKNAASERLVPVHPELERLGFIAFAEDMKERKEPRLFPKLTPGPYGKLTHKWGQWFSEYLRKVCLVTDRRMVFHSFRHTFTDHLRRPDIPEGIQRQLAGHSSKDVHDDYGSGYNLYWLVESMKLFRVPGLTLHKSAAAASQAGNREDGQGEPPAGSTAVAA